MYGVVTLANEQRSPDGLPMQVTVNLSYDFMLEPGPALDGHWTIPL